MFAVLTVAILISLYQIFTPKWIAGSSPLSVQIRGFYDEPKDSIDVLVLGSCNVYNAINPLVLWDEYGVTSYVMGSSDQKLVTSYYYLQEALEYQNPKVVVLEALFLTYGTDEPNEAYNRRAADYLRIGENKLNLIKTFISEEQAWKKSGEPESDLVFEYGSYLFPFLRYHTRWTSLEPDDFTFWEKDGAHATKGGVPVFVNVSEEKQASYYNTYMRPMGKVARIREESKIYFEKIKELCDQRGISLMVIKSPSAYYWDYAQHQAVADYMQELEVPFIDYNLTLDVEVTDFYDEDTARMNAIGMQKVTRQFVKDFMQRFDLESRKEDPQIAQRWDAAIAEYNEWIQYYQAEDPVWERLELLGQN